MKKRGLSVALALGALATSVQATAQAAKPCLTPTEAEAMVLAMAPDALRTVGVACAADLPAGALIRQNSGPFIDRYQAEADRAWPLAGGAIAKIIGPEASAIANSTLLRPLVTTLMVPMIVGKVKPKDCPEIERIVSLMAPLPPRNFAALAVTIYRLSQDGKPDRKSPLKLCPMAAG